MLTTGLGYAFVCRGVFPTLPQTHDADLHVAKTSRGRVSMDGVMFAYLLIKIHDRCPTWILNETSFSSTRSVCRVDCYDSATNSAWRLDPRCRCAVAAFCISIPNRLYDMAMLQLVISAPLFVIPAQARFHSPPNVCCLDPRLRGDDVGVGGRKRLYLQYRCFLWVRSHAKHHNSRRSAADRIAAAD